MCVCVCVLGLCQLHRSDGDFLFLSFPPHSSAISSCQYTLRHPDREGWWVQAVTLKKTKNTHTHYFSLSGHVPTVFLSLSVSLFFCLRLFLVRTCFKRVCDFSLVHITCCPLSASYFYTTELQVPRGRFGFLRNRT